MEITPKAAKLQRDCCSPCSSVESSPCDYKEKHQPKLSASLRERLKRSRRSFISPLSVAKRLCVDDEENGQQVSADSQQPVNNPPVVLSSVDVNRNGEREGSKTLSGPAPKSTQYPSGDFAQRLRKEVKDKTETLRRLKMVKMYRSKNDLTHLQTLIDKWRHCAQAALYELQSEVPIDGRKASLSELIDLFNLDESILHFDRTEDDFTT
ncbi:swi5-dependent recombination DNA repair protein 1 homolog [Maylandia zebra]|uniref:Swi5-dependent recombination DNA repair protein 1 homolog n=3 Tax=Haplochromini TaxID=319058 RepID=A0A3Q2VW97_HAPBU|nr:swi5-dependent recombination DNA repair protein 1 homolog [Maylandia zebra]XP_005914188.1 swi5-dependent recombination DNA repair protein 1 homolog [Haplochromis burtoni]XP_026046234.1 swi5-dependent recombination DNA repair protein 1 homolog [Astatotilapia calliptera]